MNFLSTFLKKYWAYFAAFLLPFCIMFSIYLSQGIYWGSDTSPLLGDGFHQYVIFDVALRNILHGSDSLFYSFTSGLGLNFYALSSYYLGSFFSPFVYFFDVKNMPNAVYLFTMIKFGMIGLSGFVNIKGIYEKIAPPLILLLSTSFALMSFATSQLEIKTWLDVFILVPCIIHGLDKLIKKQGRVLYFVSLSLLFIQNYYFGYMMALFLIFWFLIQISWNPKERISSILDFTVVSTLAGITSLVMILPTFLDLQTHGEKLTTVDKLISEDAWYLDLFAKNFIGSFDTTKYGSIPMISVGLIPLLLAILFFTLKEIRFHVKLAHFFLIAIFIASFWIQPLDLFWQGMHAPNMFLHRYAWLWSLLIILMAAETLQRLKQISFVSLYLSFSIVCAGFIATFIYRKEYEFLTPINFVLTLEFLLTYFLIFSIFIKKLIPYRLFHFSLLFFVLFELSLNSFYQVDGIAKEWVFASKSSYEENLTEIDTLVNLSNEKQDTFFRTEELEAKTGNDSMKYNYYGISQFSSVRNTMTSSVLDKLGFKSAGTNLNLRYQNNSILMDSLFGVQYNLAKTNPQKFGFTPIQTQGNLTLYENKLATSLAFLTDKVYKDVTFDHLTLDNQGKFLNQVTGLDYTYFHRIQPIFYHNIKENNGRITVDKDNERHTDFASARYTLQIPRDSQVYLTIPELIFSNDDNKTVDITVNHTKMHYTTNNVFSFFNCGFFKAGEEVELILSFPDNSQVSFNKPEFFALDLSKYQTAMEQLKHRATEVKIKNGKVVTQFDTDNETSLFFTLPYDKGWTASLNGQAIPITKTQGGFMSIKVPKGEGQVVLSFFPQGLKEGILSFLVGILIFILFDRKQRLKYKIEENSPN